VLVERVVQLIRDGVTGMDLLEVFLRRRIQPLQARDHPMWMYSGIDDSTRIHPEEVDEDTVEKWLGKNSYPSFESQDPHTSGSLSSSRHSD